MASKVRPPRTDNEWQVAEALLEGAKPQSEICDLLGKDKSTVRAVLARLVKSEVLKKVDLDTGHIGSGHFSALYSLEEDAVRLVAGHHDERIAANPNRPPRPGDHIVTVSCGSTDRADLLRVLADPGLSHDVATVTETAGDAYAFSILFHQAVGHHPAERLAAALNGAGWEATSATVSAVRAGQDLQAAEAGKTAAAEHGRMLREGQQSG